MVGLRISTTQAGEATNRAYARIARAWRVDRSHLPLVILVLILGFTVLYPLGAVVINSVLPDSTFGGLGLGVWSAAFAEPGMVEAITNTLKVVAWTQGLSLPIAIFIAWTLARTNIPFSRWIEFGFWVLFFLPSLGVTTGWLLLFDPDYGMVNKWLVGLGWFEESPFSMYSFGGIVFAHLTTYSIAVKVMLLTPTFRNLDGAIEEASRICGASAMTTLMRVVVPIMIPAILVVGLMGVIHGLEAFEIELFLGTPFDFQVFSTKIFLLLEEDPAQYAKAGVLATSILVMMLPLIVLQRWATTRRSYAVVSGRSSPSVTQLGRWRWPVFVVLLGIVLCMSLLPLGLLLTGSFMNLFGFFHIEELWTLDHWRKALQDVTFVTGFWNMLKLGAGTAFCAVFFYSIVAYCTVRVKSRWQAPLDFLTWLPLAVPGIILGFGYLFMVLQVPVFRPLYGTMGVLILVGFLASMTLGVQMIKVHMLQLGADVEEAGRVVGGSWVRTFRSIIVPLTVPTMAVVGVLVFASAIRQVGSIILLSTGETRVLSILQLEFLTEGMLGPAAVIGAVIVLISLIAAVIVRVISVRFGVQTRGG